MSGARAKILRQRPFSGERPSEPLPEAAEIEAALRECETGGLNNRDAGRVAAYAWYHGVAADRVLDVIRKAGAGRVLLRELSGHQAPNARDDAQLIASLAHRGNPSDVARLLGSPELGWALAVVSAVEVADFSALISNLDSPDDALRLILFYFLVTIVPQPFRLSLTKKLAGGSGAIFRDVFIVLVCRWAEDAILFDEHPIEAILSEVEAARAIRAVVIGAVFDHVLRRFAHARLPDAEQTRLNQVWEQINSIGKRLIQGAADIDAVLGQAGTRDLEVLAAMSEWRGDAEMAAATAVYMGKRARKFLKRSFDSAMYDLEGEGADTRFSERIIEPLIRALKFDGIDVALFRKLHERLAWDAFSRMTRYATWLNDRKRAIALIVIAGMVARERSDQALLSAVAQASAELLSQPGGLPIALNPEAMKQVAAALGFEIPTA